MSEETTDDRVAAGDVARVIGKMCLAIGDEPGNNNGLVSIIGASLLIAVAFAHECGTDLETVIGLVRGAFSLPADELQSAIGRLASCAESAEKAVD